MPLTKNARSCSGHRPVPASCSATSRPAFGAAPPRTSTFSKDWRSDMPPNAPTKDGEGSKGALHGLTRFSMEDAPANSFFLEYLSRPPTAEIFFEDVLMALVFYGMPILAENNKPRLLYYLRRRGYRGFSMNRPDKIWNKLSTAEKEVGGIPNSSEDIKQAHAAAIEMYIQDHVGIKQDGTFGDLYFNELLNDWSRFDINKRTKHDASISSGLAIMANNRHLYRPNAKVEKPKLNINVSKYSNTGTNSQIIK